MKWDAVQKDWGRFRPLVQRRWSRLDGLQLDAIAGRRGELLNRIEEEYGVSRGESEGQLDAWLDAQD